MTVNPACPACGSRASEPHCPSRSCKWRNCVCERTYDPQTGRHMESSKRNLP